MSERIDVSRKRVRLRK